jgi:hypothetical protein
MVPAFFFGCHCCSTEATHFALTTDNPPKVTQVWDHGASAPKPKSLIEWTVGAIQVDPTTGDTFVGSPPGNNAALPIYQPRVARYLATAKRADPPAWMTLPMPASGVTGLSGGQIFQLALSPDASKLAFSAFYFGAGPIEKEAFGVINAADGTILWQHAVGGLQASITWSGSTLIVIGGGAVIAGYSGATGATLWSTTLSDGPFPVWESCTVSSGTLYAGAAVSVGASNRSGYLYAVDPATGILTFVGSDIPAAEYLGLTQLVARSDGNLLHTLLTSGGSLAPGVRNIKPNATLDTVWQSSIAVGAATIANMAIDSANLLYAVNGTTLFRLKSGGATDYQSLLPERAGAFGNPVAQCVTVNSSNNNPYVGGGPMNTKIDGP